jgi:hypothetical protein
MEYSTLFLDKLSHEDTRFHHIIEIFQSINTKCQGKFLLPVKKCVLVNNVYLLMSHHPQPMTVQYFLRQIQQYAKKTL